MKKKEVRGGGGQQQSSSINQSWHDKVPLTKRINKNWK